MFSLNDYFNQVFVINLDRDKERLIEVGSEFKKINTKFERHAGVIPTPEDRRLYASAICQKTCPNSVLGIYMAHRQLWEYVVKEKLPSAVIFEDDVRFTSDIDEVLPKAFEELPANWDILYLGCISCYKPSILLSLADISSLTRGFKEYSEHLVVPPLTLGLHAYAITYEGAKKLLNLLPNVTNHVDNMISMKLDNLEYYALRPIVAYQDEKYLILSNNTNNAPVILNTLLSYFRVQPSNPYDKLPLTYVFSVPIITIPNTNLVVHVWAVLIALFAIFVEDTWKYVSAYLIIDMIYVSIFGKITSFNPYYSMWILLALGTILRIIVQSI